MSPLAPRGTPFSIEIDQAPRRFGAGGKESFTVKKMRLALAALLALIAVVTAVPKAQAETCPLYRHCMVLYPEGTCLCDGFYCNGQFICGIPIQ
jgi:hypothetical protein